MIDADQRKGWTKELKDTKATIMLNNDGVNDGYITSWQNKKKKF